MTLASSSPPIDSDDEVLAPPRKRSKARATKSKTSVISPPETEEEIHNAKAIAAGRARYAADKLAAEIKKGEVEDAADEEGVCDGEPLGMNIDSGEDEGLTAYELVKNEAFVDGVEV